MLYLYHRQIKYKDKEHINVIINYASESTVSYSCSDYFVRFLQP